jgi:hypothetical protein
MNGQQFYTKLLLVGQLEVVVQCYEEWNVCCSLYSGAASLSIMQRRLNLQVQYRKSLLTCRSLQYL